MFTFVQSCVFSVTGVSSLYCTISSLISWRSRIVGDLGTKCNQLTTK